jgi:hypothetical protein
MGKITNEMIEQSYVVGKDLYLKKTTLKKGLELLTSIGMNESSAVDYI